MRNVILAAGLCLAVAAIAFADPDTRPAEPSTRPTLFDLSAILRQLPRDARPPKSGWDEFTQPKAHKWLVGQLAGKAVTIPMQLESVTVERIPKPGDPDETQAWKRSLVLRPNPVKGLPFPSSQSLAARQTVAKPDLGETPNSLYAYVTEDEARQARDWKPGQPLLVTGEILDIEMRAEAFIVVLTDCRINPPPTQPRGK